MRKKKKLHYSIYITALGFLTLMSTMGFAVTTFSTFMPYLMREWGLSHTLNGTLMSIRLTAVVCSMFLCGRYQRYLGYRKGIAIALFSEACGFLIFAFGTHFVHGIAAMILIGAANGFGGLVTVSALLRNWFCRHGGFAVSICGTATGFAAVIQPVVNVWLTETYSLRISFLVFAAVAAIIGTVDAIFLRNTPEETGVRRLGEEEAEGGKSEEAEKDAAAGMQYGAGRLENLLIIVATFMLGVICNAWSTYNTVSFTTAGWSMDIVAEITSIFGAFLIAGKLTYGKVSDSLPQRKSAILWYTCILAGHLMFTQLEQPYFTQTMLLLAHLIAAFGFPTATVGPPIYAMDMTDGKNYADLVRYYLISYNIGSVLFSQLVGILADKTGGYTIAYVMCVIATVIAFIFVQTAYHLAEKKQIRKSDVI